MDQFPKPQGQPPQKPNPLGSVIDVLGQSSALAPLVGLPPAPPNPFGALLEFASKNQQPKAPPAATPTPQGAPTPQVAPPVIIPPDPPKSGDPIIEVQGGIKGHYWAAQSLQKGLAYLKELGLPFHYTQGFRTYDQQAAMYAKYGPGMAAPPGSSNHEKGWAFDMDMDDKAAKILEEFGFARPFPDKEPWHFAFQPSLPKGSNERVWKDNDPRMRRFSQKDSFLGSPRHVAQSLTTQEGYNNRDTSIFLRLWDQESGFNHKAVSPAGAIGIGQIMPDNLPPLLVEIGATPEQYMKDPSTQVRASLAFMQKRLKEYDGNWAQALAAYNGGQRAVAYAKENGYFPASDDPSSWYQQTLNYVAKILQVPRNTAMKWISGVEQGPVADIPAPEAGQKAAEARLKASAARVVENITKGFADNGLLGVAGALVSSAQESLSRPTQQPGVPPQTGMFSSPGAPPPAPPKPGPQLAQAGPGSEAFPDVGAPGLGPAAAAQEPPIFSLGPKDPQGNPLEVAGVTHDGKTYYRDPNGNLYNSMGRPAPKGMTLTPGPKGLTLQGGPAEGPETWTDRFSHLDSDVYEAGRSLGRGIAGGILGAAHLMNTVEDLLVPEAVQSVRAETMQRGLEAANATLNATGVVPKDIVRRTTKGAETTHDLVAKAADVAFQFLQPTKGGTHEKTKEFARDKLGVSEHAGLLEWMWAAAMGPKPVSDRIGGVLANVSTEAPYLAGMWIMSEVLGPQGLLKGSTVRGASGQVDKFTGAAKGLGALGGLTYEAALKIPGLKNMVGKLSKPFFEEMSIFGHINGLQMLSETTSAAIAQGDTPNVAVAKGLAAGAAGFAMGMGFGLGATSLGFGLTAVKSGTQNQASKMVLASAQALKNWQGLKPAAASILKMVDAIDQKTSKGWFASRVLTRVTEAIALSRKVRDTALRENTAKAMKAHANELRSNGQAILQQAESRKQLVDSTTSQIQTLDQQIQSLEQANPNVVQGAQAKKVLDDTSQQFRSINGQFMSAHSAGARGASPQQVADMVQKVVDTHGKSMGFSNYSEFMKLYNKAKSDYLKAMASFEADHGVRLDVVEAYNKASDTKDQLGTALKAHQNDPSFVNYDHQVQVAQVFDDMAITLESKADAVLNHQLGANWMEDVYQAYKAPAPGSNVPAAAQAEAYERFQNTYQASLDAVIDAGLAGDPVKSPLAFQVTRTMRELVDSDAGSIVSRVNTALDSINAEIAQITDRLKTPIKVEGKAPRMPSKSRAATDPKYPKVLAKRQAELTQWEATVRPILEQQRQADRARLMELKSRRDTLKKTQDQFEATSSMTSPDAPMKNAVRGKIQEITAAMDQEVEALGIQDGVSGLNSLRGQATVTPGKVIRQLKDSDKPRIGQAPSPPQRQNILGPGQKAPRKGSKARAVWDANQAKQMSQAKANHASQRKAWEQANEDLNQKIKDIENGGEHVLIQELPPGWVPPKAQNKNQSFPVRNPDDPIILKEGPNGTFEVVDGNYRLAQAGPDTPVSAWVPKKALDNFLESRLRANSPNGSNAADYVFGGKNGSITLTTAKGATHSVPQGNVMSPDQHPQAQARLARHKSAEQTASSAQTFSQWFRQGLDQAEKDAANAAGVPVQALSPAAKEQAKKDFFDSMDLGLVINALEAGEDLPWSDLLQHWTDRLAANGFNASNLPAFSAASSSKNASPLDLVAALAADMTDSPTHVDGVTHAPSGATTTQATTRFDPQAEANAWFNKLTPKAKEKLLVDEFNSLTDAFLEGEMPSLKAFRALMALDPSMPQELTSSAAKELVGDVQHLNSSLEVIRNDLDYLHNSKPTTIGGMMARSGVALHLWAGKVQASRRVADHVSANFREMLIDALGLTPKKVSGPAAPSLGTALGKPSSLATYLREYAEAASQNSKTSGSVEIPQALREEMVDAIESMTTDSGKMKALLAKNPALREVFGTYFQLVQQWEKLKINSPEMRTMFRHDVFFHTYPTLREVYRRIKSSGESNQIPFTQVVSETQRSLDTLADARAFYATQQERVLKGSWDKIKDAPKTDAGREERFLRSTDEERAEILGVTLDEKGAKEVNQAVVGLCLKNPVTDPAVMIQNHIRAVYNADATRQMFRDLANVAVPGLNIINSRTGRPYSMVEHFPRSQSSGAIPAVPSLKARVEYPVEAGATPKKGQPKLSRYVSLAIEEFGMSENTPIRFGDRDIPAGELYIHPDVAEIIQNRFLSKKSDFGSAMESVGELIRSGQLIGAPGAHAINILTDHWISLGADALHGMIIGRHSPLTAASRLLTAPFDAVGMGIAGNRIGGDVRLYMDAQIHGANFNTWDTMVRTAATQAMELAEGELGARSMLDQGKMAEWLKGATTKDESFGEWWNRTRDGYSMVGGAMETGSFAAKTVLNAGLNADYWANNYLVFEPIKQSMLAAYHYWTAVYHQDMGKKMIAKGISESTAMRMCKTAASDYVNTVSGSLQQSKDPKWFRDLVYSPFGILGSGVGGATAPGWMRAKLDALLTPLDRFFDKAGKAAGKEDGGRLSRFGAEDVEFRNYVRGKWESTLLFGLVGSYASMQMWNLLTSGHPTYTHQDPSQMNRIQHGDVSYPWPFVGMYRDMFNMLDAGLQQDVHKALSIALINSVNPFPGKMALEVAQDDANATRIGGREIPITHPSAGLGEKTADVAKYLLLRSITGPLETMGIEDPTGAADPVVLRNFPQWVLQSTLGIRVKDYSFHPGNRARIEQVSKAYESDIQMLMGPDIKRARNGDAEAMERVLELGIAGIPIREEDQELLNFQDTYRLSPDQMETLMKSMMAEEVYYQEGLGGMEKAKYWEMLDKYEQRQRAHGLQWLINKATGKGRK